jgi:hypothetical protein
LTGKQGVLITSCNEENNAGIPTWKFRNKTTKTIQEVVIMNEGDTLTFTRDDGKIARVMWDLGADPQLDWTAERETTEVFFGLKVYIKCWEGEITEYSTKEIGDIFPSNLCKVVSYGGGVMLEDQATCVGILYRDSMYILPVDRWLLIDVGYLGLSSGYCKIWVKYTDEAERDK